MSDMVVADDGFFFGLGAFETIAVENGRPVLLAEHLDRLEGALRFLRIDMPKERVFERVRHVLDSPSAEVPERQALKVTVTPHNLVAVLCPNAYTDEDYRRAFSCDVSSVYRNETSPFTFHKTLNYADCLYEKRKAHERCIDEPLFSNTRGHLCEGATTNLFIVRDGCIMTPPVTDGLLPGIMRSFVMERADVSEATITVDDAKAADEMFLTNSLLGIMPVSRFCGRSYESRAKSDELSGIYRDAVRNLQA